MPKKKPTKKTSAKSNIRAAASPAPRMAAAALDPRPAVHQCILNAGATDPFPANAPLSSINAEPGAVQACVNGVFVTNIIVTGGDSENTIVAKV